MASYLNWFCYLFLIFNDQPAYADVDLRIIGGQPIKIEEVPFFARYKQKGSDHGCGATIVSERFLISAAHCYDHIRNDGEIVVGTDKLGEGEHYEILEAHPHPEYNDIMFDYDVVVIKLVKELVFSSKVQPINLADRDMEVEDDAVFKVMGFGINDSGVRSSILLQVEVPYVNSEECQKVFPFITPRTICAGEVGKGACNGDSGGPLLYQNKLIGIVSFGSVNCTQDGPSAFSRVSALRDFIDEQMAT